MNRIAVRMSALLVLLAGVSWASAETTVTLERTHLCCGSCVKGVAKAVGTVDGAKAACDQKAGKVTVTAPDEATAQKAVDALVAAGFYGKTTGAEIKNDVSVPSGNVKSATLSGVHNCCKKCATAINKVIKSVPGATGEVEPKSETFTVTGDFDAAKLVEAFHDAGFSIEKIEVK
jgi:mercuric ion binding protein